MPFVPVGLMLAAVSTLRPLAEVFSSDNIKHYFIGQDAGRGVYAKEMRIPAGADLVSHTHTYDHLAILASGTAIWAADGADARTMRSPCAVTVKAGIAHSLHAVTDVVWFCIHPSDETDAASVDATLIRRG